MRYRAVVPLLIAGLGVLYAAAPAHAQNLTDPAVASKTGDSKSGDASALWGLAAPLRLSLTTPQDVFGARNTPDCDAQAEEAGNSTHGLPTFGSIGMRWTPRLSLLGFSQLGCSLHSSIGGGMAYQIPLRPNLWLVSSTGASVMPQILGQGWAIKAQTRIDLHWQVSKDSSLRAGIDALQILSTAAATRGAASQTRSLSVGGAF